MKTLNFMLLLLIAKFTYAQPVVAPAKLNSKQLLSADADQVFLTNKFLDFKDKDSLIKIVAGAVYKKTGLKNHFGYKKNWIEIENETAETYKQNDKRYAYTFQGGTMTETYTKYGNYDVRKEMKTVYNAKGFIISQTEKVLIGNDWLETKTINNEFDDHNRVIKITQKTEHKNKGQEKKEIIEAYYTDNMITVTSENGTIISKFTTDRISVDPVSELLPREIASNFIYALYQRSFDLAKKYATGKIITEIETYSKKNNWIEDLRFLEGNETISGTSRTVNDIWELKFPEKSKQRYKVKFIFIKQKNEWKIDEFKIEKTI